MPKYKKKTWYYRKAVKENGKDWPPLRDTDDDETLYHTGDERTNQNLGLAMLQITYLREHNRIADKLQDINPCWDDERLFQGSSGSKKLEDSFDFFN